MQRRNTPISAKCDAAQMIPQKPSLHNLFYPPTPFPPIPSSGVQGDVKAEPPATLKPDGKILEWVLPSKMKRGGKQIMQARLSVDDGEVRIAAIPQTAPAMVRCHLLDSMFSSVEIEAAALEGEGAEFAPGPLMKRCRVQCTQQG